MTKQKSQRWMTQVKVIASIFSLCLPTTNKASEVVLERGGNAITQYMAMIPPPGLDNGVSYTATWGPAPPYHWWGGSSIYSVNQSAQVDYLYRDLSAGSAPYPITLTWTMSGTPAGIVGAGVVSRTVMSDGRTPTELVNSPVFERAWVREKNGQWLISGRVHNESGPTIYEYWDGAQWLPMRNLLTSNTNFFSLIPKGNANPLIRSYKVATPGAVSWTYGSAPPTIDYGRVRARVVIPAGPRNRFNIKARTATMGVRG